jgi:hypothetical protein
LNGGQQIGDLSQDYSYYATSTGFQLAVDAPSSSPEPATFGLLLAGACILAAANWRRKLAAFRAG